MAILAFYLESHTGLLIGIKHCVHPHGAAMHTPDSPGQLPILLAQQAIEILQDNSASDLKVWAFWCLITMQPIIIRQREYREGLWNRQGMICSGSFELPCRRIPLWPPCPAL